MIYTDMTKKAMRICFDAHKDQVDKAGLPYVFHPFHVAEQMEDEETTAAALLHDVVEDSAWTIEDLRREGFSEPVLRALELLTHDDSKPYYEYVIDIRRDPIARAVKLADLEHNSDPARLDGEPTEADRKRLAKYERSKEILLEWCGYTEL